jgi:hypothetical protein
MQSFRLQTPRAALCSLMVATVTSVGVLGGTVALFGAAGRTPAFEPGTTLAQRAAQCPYPLSQPSRHDCLRAIAANAAKADPMLVARASDVQKAR